MPRIHVVTHPEVAIDPAVPVPRWGLSDVGRRRMALLAAEPGLQRVERLFCSDEAKAIEAAQIVADRLRIPMEIRAALGENDRCATRFMPKDPFEAAANEFFARPDRSYRGRERAVDAQARIVGALEVILRGRRHDTAIVSHGAVGPPYKCHLKQVAIVRAEDPPSQGHCCAFDAATRSLVHDWRPIAPFPGSSSTP